MKRSKKNPSGARFQLFAFPLTSRSLHAIRISDNVDCWCCFLYLIRISCFISRLKSHRANHSHRNFYVKSNSVSRWCISALNAKIFSINTSKPKENEWKKNQIKWLELIVEMSEITRKNENESISTFKSLNEIERMRVTEWVRERERDADGGIKCLKEKEEQWLRFKKNRWANGSVRLIMRYHQSSLYFIVIDDYCSILCTINRNDSKKNT